MIRRAATHLASALALAALALASQSETLSVGVPSEVDLVRRAVRPLEASGAVADPAGSVGEDFDVHLRVRETSVSTLLVEPGDGVALLDSRAISRVKGGTAPGRWSAPAPDHPAFRTGKGVLLSADPERPSRAFAKLPGGALVVLTARPAAGRAYALSAEIALGPERFVLPRPAAQVEVPRAGRLALPAPEDRPAGVEGLVGVRFERERGHGTDQWETLAEVPPGAPQEAAVDPFAGARTGAVVARLRARYIDVHGRVSGPGPSAVVVRGSGDPDARRALIDAAIGALDAPAFEDRAEARTVLLALGDGARPRLAALERDLEDGPLALAVSEVLAAIDADGAEGFSVRRLRDAARGLVPAWVNAADARDWLGEPPASLADPDPLTRAHAVLLQLDRAQRGAAPLPREAAADAVARAAAWARALSMSDPDERVRALAEFALEAGTEPSRASFEPTAPAWLVPPSERARPRPFAALSVARMPVAGDRLAFQLTARPELADLDLGPILGRLVSALEVPAPLDAPGDEVYDYDVRAADLTLQLVDRARASDAAVARDLLRAAGALTTEPRHVLEALRATSDRRIAEPLRGRTPAGRRMVALEAASLGELRAALAALDGAEWAGVDILLPPGDYGVAGEQPEFVDIAAGGVRLLPLAPGGAPVVIHAGLRVSAARDVVLEGIAVRHAAGQALTVLGGGHAVAIDAELASRGKAVFIQDSDVELVDARLRTLDEGSAFAVLVQTVGSARLFARASSLRGGSVYMGQGEGEVVLDRCVLDARERPVLQGQATARATVRESLLVSAGMGVMSVAEGFLVASVVDAHRDPLGRGSSDLRLSPRLLLIVGSDDRAPARQLLRSEPFGPR